MNVSDYPDISAALCATCRRIGERGWCLATSGNFSTRIDDAHCLITQSGRQKSQLTADDLMICDFDGQAFDDACRPSAETPLHSRLYRLDDSIGAVLHTHSLASTILSRRAGETLSISGFEMQKAISGVTTHEQEIRLHVFDNDQDMDAFASRLEYSWRNDLITVPGFLIAGHGLYAWGRDLAEAERHVEGFEFLFECLLYDR